MYLEDQFLVEPGPYKDVNGDVWVKCSNCKNPYHLNCLNIPTPPPWTFLLFFSFMQCKTMNYVTYVSLVSPYVLVLEHFVLFSFM